MILIADGGSTKASWCMIDDQGVTSNFDTEGYNPHFVDAEYIIQSIHANFPARIEKNRIREIYFYGAGCMAGKSVIVEHALNAVFPQAKTEVSMDLLAASRALLGRTSGFAAILGTGTNTCLYDGRSMIQNIDSLGFLLGDEGSGGAIGKRLLSDYMRDYLPDNLTKDFFNSYRLTFDDIMHEVYTQPMANRYCAGFCKFIIQHMDEDYMQQLVRLSFRDFFSNLVSRYPKYQSYSFNCVGSIGYGFRLILTGVANDFGMTVGNIIQSPMEGLVRYHAGQDAVQA